jgi:hypothetical protein
VTWQSTRDVLEKEGPFAGQTPGCPYCGTVIDYTTSTGHGVSYPGVECCAPAIRRQIAWRTREIEVLKKRIEDRRREVEELQRSAVDGDRGKLAAAARAQRAFDSLLGPEGAWSTELRELSREIVRLKRKLPGLEDRAA